MKKLYLIRHARSSWDGVGFEDFYRPLKPSGINDAIEISHFLNSQHKILPEIIICSPAIRALSTAIIFSREMFIPNDKIFLDETIYESSKEELKSALKKLPNDNNTVMLFGHDTSLTEFANYLTDQNTNKIPTSGIVGIQLNIDSWSDIRKKTGEIFFAVSPKKIEKRKVEKVKTQATN